MKRAKKLAACVMLLLVLLAAVVAGNYVVRLEETVEAEKRVSISEKEMEKWKAPSEKFLEYYGLGVFRTNLPVVYMNTNGQQVLKENKIWGNIALLDANGEEQSIISVPNALYRATIKYRGASSYSGFDKKQYRIKFYKNDSDGAKNVSLAGMGANSEWVLNGPYLDKTLMRNKLVYDLARELNGWAPDSRFVELFVDGEYQGVYLAVEPVTNGESRLRLSEFGLLSGETAYIVGRDRLETGTSEIETSGKTKGYTNNTLYLRYPSESNVTERQWEYIVKDISDFEEVLYGEDFTDSRMGYLAYIDVDNWVDYFIINEFAMNYDAGNLSTYVYKELAGKLQLAVWDFNNSFDNYHWLGVDTAGFYTVENSWLDRICEDRDFIDRVIERYRVLREGILSEEHIQELLDSYEAELGDAIERNFKIWEYSFEENLLVGKKADGGERDITSYEQAMEQLTSTIHKRLLWLDEHIEDLYQYCVE
ncbi:MAG: CotH kinase family protein [Eubacteriales bacterium]|nr:CotH kinase family protein [Eubacteriales bacterium]